MIKKCLSFVLLVYVFTACHSERNTSAQIDYARLDTLQKTKSLEIGESKQFLPGNLQDLVITEEGDIVVSDWASISITQFDANGHFVATIAKKGNGPGELSKYFKLKKLRDTLVTHSIVSKKTNYYAKNKNGRFHFIRAALGKKIPPRPLTIVGRQSDSTRYATAGRLIRNIQEAAKNKKQYNYSALVLINQNRDILKDSLALLKKGAPYISKINNGIRVETVPYRSQDWITIFDDGSYMIARADSSAFYFYNARQQLQHNVHIKVKARSISHDQLDYALKDKDKQMRSEIAARVGDTKPVFLRAWATKPYIWLKTDTGKDGKQIVVIDREGNPAGKFSLPEADDIQAIRANHIYTIHHGLKTGDTIRRYDIKLK